MRLKLVSDGTVRGTQVVCAETGEPLRGVVSYALRRDVLDKPPDVLQYLTVTVRIYDGDEPRDKAIDREIVHGPG